MFLFAGTCLRRSRILISPGFVRYVSFDRYRVGSGASTLTRRSRRSPLRASDDPADSTAPRVARAPNGTMLIIIQKRGTPYPTRDALLSVISITNTTSSMSASKKARIFISPCAEAYPKASSNHAIVAFSSPGVHVLCIASLPKHL